MAASHGLNGRIYAAGYDLSQYFTELKLKRSYSSGEHSGLGQAGKLYLPGRETVALSGSGRFVGSASAVDVRMNTALTQSGTAIYSIIVDTDAAGGIGYGFVGDNNQYDVSSPDDGIVSIAMAAQGSGSKGERSIVLFPLAARGTAASTAHNNAASSANGGSAYLQVTANTVTSLNVLIEGSATAAWAGEEVTLATFTQVLLATGVTSQRIAWTGTTQQYVRAAATVVAGGGAVTFAVMFHRAQYA